MPAQYRLTTRTVTNIPVPDWILDTPAETVNREIIEAGLDQALAGLATIADGTGTLTAAQLTDAVRLEARVLRRLARLTRALFDGTD